MKQQLIALYRTSLGDPARLVHYLARLLKDPRVPKTAKLKLAGSGLYAWVEGDVLPDSISMVPGLGFADDVVLVVHGVKCLIAETDSAVAVELWPGDEESFRRTMTFVAKADDLLYGNIRRGITGLIDKLTGTAPSGPAVLSKDETV